jgi:hypothetical protein
LTEDSIGRGGSCNLGTTGRADATGAFSGALNGLVSKPWSALLAEFSKAFD